MKQRQDNSKAWNAILQDCVNDPATHVPVPIYKPGRTFQPPELPEVMGKVYTSHPLHHKKAAPERVMKKAAQYLAAETNRRMAKYSNRKKDGRGAMVTIAIMLPICLCLASVLANYIP